MSLYLFLNLYILPPAHFRLHKHFRNEPTQPLQTTYTMFAKASTIFAVFAVAARVAVATPPACLLAGVKYVAPGCAYHAYERRLTYM